MLGHRIPYKGHSPQLQGDVFLAPGSMVIGDVTLGAQCSVWFNTVLRGDVASIRAGRACNFQDGVVIHVSHGKPVELGDHVTVGHGAVIHGCTIGDGVLIGIHATVLDGAVIGSGSIVAAGALVPPRMVVPPGSMVMGVPATITKTLSQGEQDALVQSAIHYTEYARTYMNEDLDHPVA